MRRTRAAVTAALLVSCACTAEDAEGPALAPPPVAGPNTSEAALCWPGLFDEAPFIVDVAAGGDTSCVVDNVGRVHCWGYNRLGQAAHPRSEPFLTSPSHAERLPCMTDVILNGVVGCALQQNGHAWCWGDNQLGDAGTHPFAGGQAYPIPELDEVVAVGLAAALRADGSVWSWGSQAYWPGPVPQEVEGISAAVLPTSGWGYCATDMEARVLCWGYNPDPTVPSTADIYPPTVVSVPHPVVEVGVSGARCARLNDGSVWCWGNLPLGADDVATRPPEPVVGIEDAVSLSVNLFHACVAEADGDVWCWGDGRDDALGIPGDGVEEVPVRVAGVPPVVQVSCGAAHTCALTTEGEVYCWGANTDGQLGQGTHGPGTHVPQLVEITLVDP